MTTGIDPIDAGKDAQRGPLGIVGLGLLGSALAARAIAGHWSVLGYDVVTDRREELRAIGGTPCDAAAEVAAQCSILLFALPHDGITRDVIDSLGRSLLPGTVILDATTGDADATATLGAELASRGVTYLDATISGSSVQVRDGEALFMVGGPRETFERCRPLLAVLSRQAIHTGPCGSGARMKLVTNLVLGLNRAALAEGLVLARTLDLDPAQALEVLRASMAYSRAMDTKGEKMIRGDFEPQARLSQHLKDVRLMLAAAERQGQRLPLSETHRQLLELAEHLGLGEQDNSAVLRAIEATRRSNTSK
ncbi:MAG: NAD(P)-dependent oxidoreductase [Pirellulales bacterium]|nr:NAD(P)-dependent oxidoreductase [Pirellulales bacterium]